MTHDVFYDAIYACPGRNGLNRYDSDDVAHDPIVPERNFDSPDKPVKFDVNVLTTIDIVPRMNYGSDCH